MPHFIVHCSADIIDIHSEETLNTKIHKTANQSGLFAEGDIKVRVQPFATFLVGNQKNSFIHVFASIMQGRTTEQRAQLSNAVVSMLVGLFPDIPNIAMSINEFEKSTYCNKTLL